ncbi:MAG: ferrochelatase [Planctomycetes bacterium]|nr:ferrochelatase [Planctomycetota bacterium]
MRSFTSRGGDSPSAGESPSAGGSDEGSLPLRAELHSSQGSRPAQERGVLLINLGTPDAPTPAAVRRYLAEFLADPSVIQLPRGLGWLNGPLGRMIARFRASTSAAMYRIVWTPNGSPLLTITQDQAAALQAIMPRGWRVFCAMRYGKPSIPAVLREIEEQRIEELVIVPMYPQFSGPTTGTAMREVYKYLKGDDHRLQLSTRLRWYNDHHYIRAQAELLEEFMRKNGLAAEDTYLLFSTHGLPVSYVTRGDPYPEHVAQTVALVGRQLGWPSDRMSLAFQSRFGPTKWLEPYTDKVLEELAARNEKRIVICPISFTADCLETLEELNVRYRKLIAHTETELHVCPALNTFEPFIAGLKQLVMRGSRPMSAPATAVAGITAAPTDRGTPDVHSLVMVGLSLPGRLENSFGGRSSRGPKLRHTDETGLRQAKRPACDIPALLRRIQQDGCVREGWIWNTCHRFEFYGYLNAGIDAGERTAIVDELRRLLFDTDPGDTVNVLWGPDAQHHLLRTAVGLNSCLPGERDVLEQLGAAHRLAQRAGTVGNLSEAAHDEAVRLNNELRETTDWGMFDPDYCHIALAGVAEEAGIDFSTCKVVVLGGSTTSAGVLRALRERLGVAGRQLTLCYRGHRKGGHLKVLRKAIGEGRRIRVQTYEEAAVDRCIAGADILVIGIDRTEPILNADRLARCRASSEGPLTIVDFNTFGSTDGVDDLKGAKLYRLHQLDAEVRAKADEMCSSETFGRAVEAVELRIAELVQKQADNDTLTSHRAESETSVCTDPRQAQLDGDGIKLSSRVATNPDDVRVGSARS